MIPIRSLRNDVVTAFCVVAFSVGVTLFVHTHQTENKVTAALPAQPATVVVPTLSKPNTIENVPASPITITESPTTTNATVEPDAVITTPPVAPHTTPAAIKSATSVIKSLTVKPTTPITKSPANTSKPVVTEQMTDAAYIAKLTKLIAYQTNVFRENNHLPLLSTDNSLARNATAYSNSMLAGNFLSHIDKNGCDMSCRFARDGYLAWNWGENLAVLHFETRPTPEYVASYFMQAWEKSAEHRANLMNPAYTNTGVGIALNGKTIYATVQFTKPQ
jgi:uncharacterized protein YkwD